MTQIPIEKAPRYLLDTKHRTVKECLDILAHLSGCVWSINPNGLFYFVKP